MEALTLKQIILAVDGQYLRSNEIPDIAITSISIDSRKVQPNALYIPIQGEKFDGHSFIKDAFDLGATIALTQDPGATGEDANLVYVKDTKKALMDLAAYYRSQFKIPVVAITGSVGKTSTKDLIAAVLSSKYNVHKTQGNFNNEIGLPLTVFGLNREHDVLVLEMGMNHFGEIHKLSTIAKPDIAVITNIGDSHIENLGNREGILKAKCEILDGMPKEGVLIVNGDDQLLKNISTSHQLILYGRSEKHLYYASHIKNMGIGGMLASFNTPNLTMEIKVPALGEHMVDNAVAAIAVAEQLHLSSQEIKEGFGLYKPTKMRMDLQEGKNNVYIINDAYNASPDSMKAAIAVLSTIPNVKRRIAILGDMFEMGEHAKMLHTEVGQYIGHHKKIDFLITVGNMSRYIRDGAIAHGFSKDQTVHFKSQEDLIAKIKGLIRSQDLVLVKASRGMELEKTVDEIGKVKLDES